MGYNKQFIKKALDEIVEKLKAEEERFFVLLLPVQVQLCTDFLFII